MSCCINIKYDSDSNNSSQELNICYGISWEDFQLSLELNFECPRLVLRYLDDEADLVMLSCQEELEEAFELARKNSDRLVIVANSSRRHTAPIETTDIGDTVLVSNNETYLEAAGDEETRVKHVLGDNAASCERSDKMKADQSSQCSITNLPESDVLPCSGPCTDTKQTNKPSHDPKRSHNDTASCEMLHDPENEYAEIYDSENKDTGVNDSQNIYTSAHPPVVESAPGQYCTLDSTLDLTNRFEDTCEIKLQERNIEPKAEYQRHKQPTPAHRCKRETPTPPDKNTLGKTKLKKQKTQSTNTSDQMENISSQLLVDLLQNMKDELKIDITKAVTKRTVKQVLKGLDGAVIQAMRGGATSDEQDSVQLCGSEMVITHQGIFCHNCQQLVVGVRYRCGHCRDFDLCDTCEKLPDIHHPDHVFLKIRRPCQLPIYDTELPEPLLKCAIYGSNELKTPSASHFNWDKFTHKVNRLREHMLQEQHWNDPPKKSFSSQYNAEVIDDVTLATDTIVSPGSRYKKTWSVRNIGAKTWNQNTHLGHMAVGMLKLDPVVEVPPLRPRETGVVSVTLTIPTQPGDYHFHCQLQQRTSGFGPTLSFSVNCQSLLLEPHAEEFLKVVNDSADHEVIYASVNHNKTCLIEEISVADSHLLKLSNMKITDSVPQHESIPANNDVSFTNPSDKENGGLNINSNDVAMVTNSVVTTEIYGETVPGDRKVSETVSGEDIDNAPMDSVLVIPDDQPISLGSLQDYEFTQQDFLVNEYDDTKLKPSQTTTPSNTPMGINTPKLPLHDDTTQNSPLSSNKLLSEEDHMMQLVTEKMARLTSITSNENESEDSDSDDDFCIINMPDCFNIHKPLTRPEEAHEPAISSDDILEKLAPLSTSSSDDSLVTLATSYTNEQEQTNMTSAVENNKHVSTSTHADCSLIKNATKVEAMSTERRNICLIPNSANEIQDTVIPEKKPTDGEVSLGIDKSADKTSHLATPETPMVNLAEQEIAVVQERSTHLTNKPVVEGAEQSLTKCGTPPIPITPHPDKKQSTPKDGNSSTSPIPKQFTNQLMSTVVAASRLAKKFYDNLNTNPSPAKPTGGDSVAMKDLPTPKPWKLPKEEFKLPPSEFKLPKDDYKIKQSTYKIPAAEFKLPADEFKLPTTNFKLPDKNNKLPSSLQKSEAVGEATINTDEVPSSEENIQSKKWQFDETEEEWRKQREELKSERERSRKKLMAEEETLVLQNLESSGLLVPQGDMTCPVTELKAETLEHIQPVDSFKQFINDAAEHILQTEPLRRDYIKDVTENLSSQEAITGQLEEIENAFRDPKIEERKLKFKQLMIETAKDDEMRTGNHGNREGEEERTKRLSKDIDEYLDSLIRHEVERRHTSPDTTLNAQLCQLKEMGFTDESLNADLIKEHPELDKVISLLL